MWGLGLLALGLGQVYEFLEEPLPPPRTLHVVYTFYLYGVKKPSDKRGRDAFFKVTHLKLSYEAPGVHLALMPHDKFWSQMSPQQFCCHEKDAAAGKCELHSLLAQDEIDFLYPLSTEFHDDRRNMDIGGAYFLVLTNCGDHSDATLSGKVMLKHTYGFLPGLDYAKLPFYHILSMGYIALAALWMVQSAMWWTEIGQIHICIVVVIFISLMEAFLWWQFYSDWNLHGVKANVWFILAIFATVLKSSVSYMLILVSCLGWGITKPYLERKVMARIITVGTVFMVFDTVREVALSFRHSHTLSAVFVLLCLLPVSVLVAGIFLWVFTSLSELMKSLAERKQAEKLRLFTCLWRVLVGALAIGTLSLGYQIMTTSVPIAQRWTTQWLLTDGVSHLLFLFVLMWIMYLWAPHKHSQRYAYSVLDAAFGAPDAAVSVSKDQELADQQGDSDDEYWNNMKVGNSSDPKLA
jgi:hypothetical protein